MKHELEKLSEVLTCLNERVAGLEDRLAAFDAIQGKQEMEIIELKKSLKDLKTVDNADIFENICNEATARWRKEKYLIVSGISEHSSGDLKERRQRDIDVIELLAREIGVDDIDLDPYEVSRVGRLDCNRPRLLRFKCDKIEARRQFLRNSRNLRKSPEFRSVYINPDLTLLQRKRNFDLRKEVKQRREDGENVGIRRGRISDLSQKTNFH